MPKRSLIMAGGGLKVGFQAGVLQVWLDEAGLTFDHADGASGGCFNLAMYCQGMSGKQMADNWRDYDPFIGAAPNFAGPGEFAHQQSFFTLDTMRQRLFPKWGLDWNRIRAGTRLGTFNLCNFSKKRLEVVTNAGMDEDRLVSAVSLPIWFPPVKINGDLYIDAVYLTDANVAEAIRRGADEIWAIWTVSTRDEWRPGFVEQYFQIIETVADGNFFAIWERINQNNQAIAAGNTGEFGRPIALKLLQAEVPVDYLFNFSRDRMAEAVNLGVDMARAWCRAQGVALGPPVTQPTPAKARTSLQFSEQMKGFVAPAGDFQAGFGLGQKQNKKLDVALTIATDDANAFITDPSHAMNVTGFADSPWLGGRVPVDAGDFNLLVDAVDPRKKEMRYRLFAHHTDGTERTIVGFKKVENDGGAFAEVWNDTTTLYTSIYRGHVTAANQATADQVATGIIAIQFFDFLQELTTFRVEGPTLADRTNAMTRFAMLFLGKLMDVYGGFLTTA
ncbi:MAG: patatin-like phospholipase family protein [Vicinamibacterales bacterium]